MTAPTTDGWILIIINIVGWSIAIWRKSVIRYQHRAMWIEYAEKKKIPVNGGR